MDIVGAPRTAIQIPCCLCGTMIYPNAANQCGVCLANQYNLSSVLQRGPSGGDLTIYQCRKCRRFRHTESYWESHDPESAGLLTLCLKHTPALQPHSRQLNHDKNNTFQNISSIQLMDALWIWTEPHSMRFKLALTVHAQVGESAKSVVVQQRIPVEYKVQFQMCPECNREYTNRTWHAVVQLRQRGASSTRKGLLFLEMYIAKHAELQRDVLSVQTTKNGFDFYFLQLVSAQAFASDLSKIYPMKLKTTSKMVSEDVKNNTKNMKHTLLCDLVPFSKDDLVLWDLEEGGNSSGRPSSHVKLCLVLKMAGSIHFVDAAPTGDLSMDKALMVLSPERFWKLEKQFHVMGSSRRLTRFIVLDVEWTTDISSMGHSKERVSTFLPGDVEEESPKLYTGPSSGMDKYRLAYVQVAREADMGVTDEIFHCTTHLGNLLQAGDVVVGYDMVNSVMTGAEEWMTHAIMQSNNHSIPDVVLVKKVSGVTSPMDESGKNMNKKSKTSPRKSRKGRNRKSHDVVKDDPVDEEISSWDEQSDDEEPPESGVEEDGLELSSK